LKECAANLFLNFGIDFEKAMRMTRSQIKAVFESKQFKEWKRGREAQNRLDAAQIERLDNIVRSIGSLGKVLATRRMF
jgi:hypothetical protein